MNNHIKALIGIGILAVIGLVATPFLLPLIPAVVPVILPVTAIPTVIGITKTVIKVGEVVTVVKTAHHVKGAVKDKIKHNNKANDPVITGEPGCRGSS